MSNRRPDQYYIDLYDRATIEELKLKEREESDQLAKVRYPEERVEIMFRQSISFNSFRNTAIFRARGRKESIERMMNDDERRDKLIERTPIPKGVRCKTCNSLMTVCEHFLEVEQIPLLFVFECPERHSPRRAIYPDGREYLFPKLKCEKCGFELREEIKKLKTKIVTTYSCSMCGESRTEELEIKIKKKMEEVISEDDRNKYCLSFVGRKTFMEDFEQLAEVLLTIDEESDCKRRMETAGVDKIKKVTIPQLEEQLRKAVEKTGYIKFQFEKPDTRHFVKVPFSVQDSSTRSDKESLKILTRVFGEALDLMNWRLVGDMQYRLGHLTGAFRAFETDEDLLKLAEDRNKGRKNKQ